MSDDITSRPPHCRPSALKNSVHCGESRRMKKTVQPLRLGSLSEAISLAAYVEQMLTTEMQWIMNRLQWLFTSQSFLIAAYAALLVGTPQDYKLVCILKVAIPVLGFLACTVVSGAVIAADHEVRMLANERSRISVYINGESAIQLPRIGGTADSRDRSWTQIFGTLPQFLLPPCFAFLWLILFIET